MAILRGGVRSAPGGKRKNAGRTADWLKVKCQEIIEKRNLLKFLADVADGTYKEQILDGNGDLIDRNVAADTRLKALGMLLDRGFFKVPQPLIGDSTQPIAVQVVNYAAKTEEP